MPKLNWPREFPGVHYYDKKEEAAVLSVLRSGAPFRYYGVKAPKHVEGFEARARKFYGAKHALGVNSGTGALMTAVAALGIGPGDEVIVPSFFWVSTVGAAVTANAIPVLCEVDHSLNMDPADLARKITPRTRLIIVVHMAGAPADMKAIMAVADRHNIPVLEDCAQCNGGSFGGRKVGTFGRIGMFSLQINKNCTTGEGGLLITDDPDLYGRCCAAHDVGVPWIGGGPKTGTPHVLWGSGRRMSELVGAVAGVQLGKLPRVIRSMRESKKRIKAALKGVPGIEFRKLNDSRGDTGCFLILLLADADCALAARQAMRKAGLPATRLADYGMHVYYNVPQLVGRVPLSPAGNPWKLWDNGSSVCRYDQGACPQSDGLFARSLIIPVPSCLTRAQEQAAAKIIAASVGC